MTITTLVTLRATAILTLLIAAPAPSARDTLYPQLAGSWKGTLEYQDDKPPHGRVRQPAAVAAEVSGDRSSVLLHYTYDDILGRTAEDTERFTLDASGDGVTWGGLKDATPRRYVVKALIATGGVTTLTMEGEATDEDRPTSLRETLTVGADSLQILRETRPKGGTFAFRYLYTLKRQP